MKECIQMWIIFGWEKQEKTSGEIGSAYCFDCRRESAWAVWSESEWVGVTRSELAVYFERLLSGNS